MARHKDIDDISARLHGEGWHLDYKSVARPNRRNKRSCIHYRDGICKKLCCLCMGSSDCQSYFAKNN